MATEPNERVPNGIRDPDLIENFMNSPTGRRAAYRWLCDDAERIADLYARIGELQRHPWRNLLRRRRAGDRV